MFLSQSTAQSASSFCGGAETGTKRTVTSKGLPSGVDPPRSWLEPEPLLLKKNQLKENIASQLHAVGRDPGFWPVISAESLIEELIGTDYVDLEVTGEPLVLT
jgi:hypothetical protein